MLKHLLLLIVPVLISANALGQVEDSIFHDGIYRKYHYYLPSSWTAGNETPILYVMHALTQTGEGIMDITEFNTIAEANNFIACYPTGIGGAWNANMNVSISQADDLGFIEALAVHMQNNYDADPSRQYLCGMSNGGFMSYKLACESSQCFAGIVSIAGVMSDTVYSNCNPQYAPDILHIHGTADAVVSYYGSPTTGISVDQLMEKWQNYYGCDIDPVFSTMPNPNLIDASYPERYTYTNCNNNELELIKIIGGGHQWPGILTVWGGLGTINMDFYSPQIAWDFLSGKVCRLYVELDELETQPKALILITDLLGRKTKVQPNMPLIYHYSDGSIEKVYISE